MGWLARSATVAAVAMLAIACAAPSPAPGGWYDADVHQVDGYWVTTERSCEQSDDWGCRHAVPVALAALQRSEPGAIVVGVSVAGYPNQRERPGQIDVMFAGLQTPSFVILDLADGTRRTFGLMCGALQHVDGQVQEGCEPADLEMFRVGATVGTGRP